MKSLQLLSYLLLSCIITQVNTYGGNKKGNILSNIVIMNFKNKYMLEELSSIGCLIISMLEFGEVFCDMWKSVCSETLDFNKFLLNVI